MGGELAFIDRVRRLAGEPPAGQVWIGDDAAVIDGDLLFATDALVEGVHFDLSWSSAQDVGWKALAVNLSDLAAMGGTPRAAVAAIVVPPGRPGLADEVARGLVEGSRRWSCPLVGGDTVQGLELAVTVSVVGVPSAGGAVLRSGARVGELVFVTGEFGGAAAALRLFQDREARIASEGLTGASVAELGERLRRPEPKLGAGRAAAAAGASAMIDCSDGLAVDLARLCHASGVGVRVEASLMPTAIGATLDDALHGGEDYELCFTARDAARVKRAFDHHGLAAPRAIGRLRAGSLDLVMADGAVIPLPEWGWEHKVR